MHFWRRALLQRKAGQSSTTAGVYDWLLWSFPVAPRDQCEAKEIGPTGRVALDSDPGVQLAIDDKPFLILGTINRPNFPMQGRSASSPAPEQQAGRPLCASTCRWSGSDGRQLLADSGRSLNEPGDLPPPPSQGPGGAL